MEEVSRQHGVSDEIWALLEPHLLGQPEQWGGIAKDNRKFIEAVFLILRTGLPWRELPSEYGKWGTIYQRFNRWRVKGIWEKLLEIVVGEPGFDWLMVDEGYVAACVKAAKAGQDNLSMNRSKTESMPKYIWPWMRMICRSESLLYEVPRRVITIFPFE